MNISIVIPVFNEISCLKKCLLENSRVFNRPDVQVIYVDNGSTDGSYELLKTIDNINLYQIKNVNVGAVRNYGANIAENDYILFVDSDCVIKDSTIENAKRLIAKDPSITFGGGIKIPEDSTWVEKYWLLDFNNDGTKPNRLIGAAILIKKEYFQKILGFNEVVTSGEDSDLHEKLIERGYKVEINQDISVIHYGNARTMHQLYRRISWHSENYFINFRSSIRDPMFIYTCIWLFNILGMLFFLTMNSILAFISITIFTSMPFLLSIRRIKNSGFTKMRPKGYLACYILDLIYMFSKVNGIIKSVSKKVW